MKSLVHHYEENNSEKFLKLVLSYGYLGIYHQHKYSIFHVLQYFTYKKKGTVLKTKEKLFVSQE